MSNLPACPQCTLDNTYPDGDNCVCPDCKTEQGAFMLKAEFMKKA